MSRKINDVIQVRIDSKTKNEARKIFESLGLDISTAIKMYFKQVIYTKNLPYEIRDENGMTLKKAQELRDAVEEGRNSKKSFKNAGDLLKDALS